MFGRAGRLLGSVWWLFAIASVCFLAAAAFSGWRAANYQPSYTKVGDVRTFRTPQHGHGQVLYLMLPTQVADGLPANQPHCSAVDGRPWFGSTLFAPSATRDGERYSSVLKLPKGWPAAQRVTCEGASGPAVLAAGDRGPLLIGAGVAGAGAVLAAGFAIVGYVIRPRRAR